MNRTFFLALLIFLLLFFGLATIHPAIVALALPLILYLLAGLWRAPEGVRLQAERSLSAERVKTGDEVTVTLTVSNSGSALEEVLLEDQIPGGLEVAEGSARRLVALPAGGLAELERLARELDVPLARLGTARGPRLRLAGLVDVPLAEADDAWRHGLERALAG